MAICLRRVLRSYCSLSYPSVRNQHALVDQRNVYSSSTTAMEVNQDYLVARIPIGNSQYRQNSEPARRIDTKNVKCKDTWKNELTFLGNDIYCDKLYLSSIFEKEILHCAKECEAHKEVVGSPQDRAALSQLQRIHQKLCDDLPRIFQRSQDPTIYHENLIFENNIRGTRTIGIKSYLKQIAFFRIYASVKFAYVRFDILKITTHAEDGTVRVRWRIRGVPGYKVIFLFWKEKLWKQKEIIEETDGWFDGFSIFYVKGDGLIHKHVASKMMPNEKDSVLRVKHPLAAKVALMVGLMSHDLASALLAEAECKKFLEKESSPSSS